jgi:3-dehydrosphinganine reductase
MLFATFCLVVLIPSLIVSLITYIVQKVAFTPKFNLKNKTVLITGGSSGIGLELAIEAIKQQAKTIYIVARNKKNLEDAQECILQHRVSENQKVLTISCDVTDIEQVKQVKDLLLNDKELKCSSLDFVFINQGNAEPGYFLEQDETLFKRMIDVNYLGGVYMTKALLPIMMLMRETSTDSKHLIFISSAAGVLPMIGYTAYCPSKFAIRAFAECMQAELDGEDIFVHCALPVDCATPGYAKENETKPPETLKLSEMGGLKQPSSTAKAIWSDIKKGHFIIIDDIGVAFLFGMTKGFAANFTFLHLDWFITCLGSFFAPFLRLYFWYIPYTMRAARRKRFLDAIVNDKVTQSD